MPESCLICGSAIRPRYEIPAVRRWGSDSDLHVYWCGDCDAGFLLPRPSQELLDMLYSEQYFANYSKPVATNPSALDRARVHLAWRFDRSVEVTPSFFESIVDKSSATICDLGCGNGTLLEELRDRGFRVVGVEPSPFARQTVESKGINVYEGAAECLPGFIPEAPFDVVVMKQVLEHCLDPQLAVRNALELVRAGGYLVIDVPNCASFQFANRGPTWFHFDVGRHVNYFTPRSLAKLVRDQGAKVDRFYYRQYVPHFIAATINLETFLWDRSHTEENSRNLAGIRRPSKVRNWLSLLGTFAMKPERKYGCLGIVARKG